MPASTHQTQVTPAHDRTTVPSPSLRLVPTVDPLIPHRYLVRTTDREKVNKLRARFLDRVNFDGKVPDHRPELGPCWVWTGGLYSIKSGYGGVYFNGSTRQAHRVMWMLMRGSIRGGLTVDHLCARKICVNPRHMELVTRAENARRHHGVIDMPGARTHCPHGHPYDELNTVICTPLPGSKRQVLFRRCRTCRAAENAARVERRRAERATPQAPPRKAA